MAAIVGISVVVGIAYLPLTNTTTTGGLTNSTSLGVTTTRTIVISTNGNTTMSGVGYPTSGETTNSTLGLKLAVSLQNSSLYYPGQNVSISITEYNVLAGYNNVSASNEWPAQTTPIEVCDAIYPLQLGVISGYYDASNMSQASASQVVRFIDPNLVYHCPAIPAISFYNFEPNSDIVDMCFGSNASSCYSPMTASVKFNGTWIGGYSPSGNPGNATLQNLSPGVYTAVGGDEWGQLVLLHFTIVPNNLANQNTIAETWPFSGIPENFTLGVYSFGVSFQGMHNGPTLGGNGSTTTMMVYLGNYATLYVSNSSETESVMFSWSPNANQYQTIPDPSSATLFNGKVAMNCFANTTGSYVTISVVTISVGTPVQETTTSYQSSYTCIISAEPTGFYLHVITDGTPKPIQGAKLTATLVSQCNNVNSTLVNGQGFFTTNSTGWATVSMPFVASGNFFLVFDVQYSNSTYSFSKTFDVYWAPQQGTFVTVSLPSGTVSMSYRYPIRLQRSLLLLEHSPVDGNRSSISKHDIHHPDWNEQHASLERRHYEHNSSLGSLESYAGDTVLRCQAQFRFCESFVYNNSKQQRFLVLPDLSQRNVQFRPR